MSFDAADLKNAPKAAVKTVGPEDISCELVKNELARDDIVLPSSTIKISEGELKALCAAHPNDAFCQTSDEDKLSFDQFTWKAHWLCLALKSTDPKTIGEKKYSNLGLKVNSMIADWNYRLENPGESVGRDWVLGGMITWVVGAATIPAILRKVFGDMKPPTSGDGDRLEFDGMMGDRTHSAPTHSQVSAYDNAIQAKCGWNGIDYSCTDYSLEWVGGTNVYLNGAAALYIPFSGFLKGLEGLNLLRPILAF